MNLISSEEVNLLESGENANEKQDEQESFALAEVKQGMNPHVGYYNPVGFKLVFCRLEK